MEAVSYAGVITAGFTLTKAANPDKVEPNHSAGTNHQAYKRAHRIGQKRPYTIWQLRAVDSVEEEAEALSQENKANFIANAYALYGIRFRPYFSGKRWIYSREADLARGKDGLRKVSLETKPKNNTLFDAMVSVIRGLKKDPAWGGSGASGKNSGG